MGRIGQPFPTEMMGNIRRDMIQITDFIEKVSHAFHVAPEGTTKLYFDDTLGDYFDEVQSIFSNWYLRMYRANGQICVTF